MVTAAAATRSPLADRGRCYYWRQTLGETSSSHMIVFQPGRLDGGIMGRIPLGSTTELYGCYLLRQPQKLNWYFFKQAQKQIIGFITQSKTGTVDLLHLLNYLIEIVTCGDNNKSIFGMNCPQRHWFGPVTDNPLRHTVCVLSLLILTNGNVIIPVTAQMHTLSQPKLMVLKDLNRDKSVTDCFSFILMYTSIATYNFMYSSYKAA